MRSRWRRLVWPPPLPRYGFPLLRRGRHGGARRLRRRGRRSGRRRRRSGRGGRSRIRVGHRGRGRSRVGPRGGCGSLGRRDTERDVAGNGSRDEPSEQDGAAEDDDEQDAAHPPPTNRPQRRHTPPRRSGTPDPLCETIDAFALPRLSAFDTTRQRSDPQRSEGQKQPPLSWPDG